MKGAQLDIPGEIEFDVGKATMKDTANTQTVLAAVLKAMKDLPTVKVRVEGHTDSDGVGAANMALSKERAAAVVTWLTGHGIEAGRLHVMGCGAKTPLVPNTSPENKARNRRTEFDVEEMDGKKPDGFTEACAPNPAAK
jgi:OOP family OmpA-OmpF porin